MYITRLVNIGANTWKLDLIEKNTRQIAAYVCYEKDGRKKTVLGDINYISPYCRSQMKNELLEKLK